MKTLSYSKLRQTLAATMDLVNDNHEPVIVTRANGKSAVLMSLEDFASYEETRHLTASPKNADRLEKSVRELEAGRGRQRELIE